MKSYKARGIVLKETLVGEADKFVVVLLKGFGKLSVSAKGARKPASKFLAGTQPFTYSDFVIYDGGRFQTLSQIDIIESFYGLRDDYDKLCYGNYLLELCDKLIMANEECDDLLLLLLKTLSALSRNKVTPILAARVFELKLLQLTGYAPETNICAECGDELNAITHFYINGCICTECSRKFPDSLTLPQPALKAIEYILTAPYERLFSFKVAQPLLAPLKAALWLLMDAHFDAEIKSRRLLPENNVYP